MPTLPFDQGCDGAPFDRVVAVRPVVAIGQPLAVRVAAAPHVHRHEDVAARGEVAQELDSVLPAARLVVGRSREDHRKAPLGRGPRDVGGQLHAVAHLHAQVEVRPGLVGRRGGSRLLRSRSRRRRQPEEHEGQQDSHGCRSYASACVRSSIRSSGCSSPTETRRRFCGVGEPGPSLDARCSMRVSVPPRLVALVRSRDAGGHADRGVLASPDAEREHAAEAAHLPAPRRVSRMGLEARVVHHLDVRCGLERLRDGESVGAVTLHPTGQGPQPAQHQPRVEGRGDRPEDVPDMFDLRGRLAALAQDQRAALHVAVSAKVLRRGVQDGVGAQLERPLERRRCEGPVHDQLRADPLRDRRQSRQIHDLHQRVRRRLRPDQPRVRLQGFAHAREIGHVERGRFHSPARQELLRDRAEAVVDVIREDHVGSGREGLQIRCAGSEARSEHQRGRAALDLGQGLFQPRLRRVALADVHVPGRTLARRAVLESRREMDGRSDGAGGRVRLASRVDGPRLKSHGSLGRACGSLR